jgi:nucleoside recognition membrane protein YjiH
MDLNYILKLCWTIIVVILTLIVIIAFIETIIKKIQEPKRKKEQIQALDKFTEDFINAIKENKEDKPKAKKRTTKKKED